MGQEEVIKIIDSINNICNKIYLKSRTEETKEFNSGLSKMLNCAAWLFVVNACVIVGAVKIRALKPYANAIFLTSLIFATIAGFL